MNVVDAHFAPFLKALWANGWAARTDRKGRTSFFMSPPKRGLKRVCTQPSNCPGLSVCGKKCVVPK